MFLADSPYDMTLAIQLINPMNAAHLLIIQLQLQEVISYFDMCSPSMAKYENEEIPKIHLIAEEPPWDPST